jgi:hypothetical protein
LKISQNQADDFFGVREGWLMLATEDGEVGGRRMLAQKEREKGNISVTNQRGKSFNHPTK